MPGKLLSTPTGVQDGTGVPPASVVTANTRVKTASGFIAIVSDILSFPGPSTVGNWIVPNSRTTINGVPTIGQGCAGQAIVPGTPPTPSPLTIVSPDPKVSGS